MAINKVHKEDLFTDLQRRQAAQEFPLHCSLHHDKIVKGYEWNETEKEYMIVMEFMNEASYFHDTIEVVSFISFFSEDKLMF